MKKQKSKIIILICLIILFILNTLFVINGKYAKLDEITINFFNHFSDKFIIFFQVFSFLGGTLILPIIAIVCVFIFYIFKRKKQSIFLALSITMSAILNLLIKNIVKRPRNENFRYVAQSGFSYPSGHTVNNIVFYSILLYFLNKDIQNKKIKYIINAITIIYVFLVVVSRLYFRYHYISDIIGALIESGIIIILINLIYMRLYEQNKS